MKKLYTLLFSLFAGVAAYAQPSGWTYSLPIDVQNNMSVLITDYQLQLTLNTQALIGAGQMNANGSDIRFGKNCTGTVLYNYWIESGINTASTVIWVKVDSLPASSTRQIFMYYGNVSAPALSAIAGTFIGPHSTTDSTSGANTGGVGNSQRGFRFSPTETILATAFGKNEPTGTTRYVTLFDYTTQAILSQQQVSGPAAQFSYQNITNPMWLTQGTQYILEIFQGPSDGYYFGAPPNAGQHITFYDMRYCNSCTQNTFPTNSLGGMHYGYVDMWYFTKQNVANAPTYSLGVPLTTTNSGPGTICMNDSTLSSVTATGGATPYTYSWSPLTGVGSPTSASTMLSPPATQTYTVIITDNCGSTSTQTITITVNALPAVTASVSTDSVCMGNSFTPMGGGAVSYAWSGGLTDNTPSMPLVTDTYTVTGTDANGCTATATATVEVLALPVVTAIATDSTICSGDSVVFTGTGAATYSWDNGVMDSIPYTPVATMTYEVVGTDMYGCANFDSVTVIVNANPVIVLSSTGSPYCAGAGTAAIAASGADTYDWNPGAMTGSSISVSPAVTTTYTVLATDTLTGCTTTDEATVIVNDNPVLTGLGDTVCSGNCVTFVTATTGGNPAYMYNWTPTSGLDSANVANPTACNAVTTCYTATVTDANGCADTLSVCADVNPLPVVAASGPSTTCVTDGAYALTGTPASGTFSGPGVTGNSFNPATAGNGTHQVIYTYTDANGCTAMDTISIVVSPCVGISENNGVVGKVYPNPFNTILTLELRETGTVRMINSLGQVVFEQEMNSGKNEINTSTFGAGVYLLAITTTEGTSTVKVVKE